eukprot:112050_1
MSTETMMKLVGICILIVTFLSKFSNSTTYTFEGPFDRWGKIGSVTICETMDIRFDIMFYDGLSTQTKALQMGDTASPLFTFEPRPNNIPLSPAYYFDYPSGGAGGGTDCPVKDWYNGNCMKKWVPLGITFDGSNGAMFCTQYGSNAWRVGTPYGSNAWPSSVWIGVDAPIFAGYGYGSLRNIVIETSGACCPGTDVFLSDLKVSSDLIGWPAGGNGVNSWFGNNKMLMG